MQRDNNPSTGLTRMQKPDTQRVGSASLLTQPRGTAS
jgi:hypothetical protein